MSSIQFHPNELMLIYYAPTTITAKQTRAYAKSVANNINEVDISKNKLTTTLWKEIVNKLNMHPEDIMDKSSSVFKEKFSDSHYTMTGLLEALVHEPQLLKYPVAIYQKRAVFCQKPTDILRLEVNSRVSHKIPPHLKSRSAG